MIPQDLLSPLEVGAESVGEVTTGGLLQLWEELGGFDLEERESSSKPTCLVLLWLPPQ